MILFILILTLAALGLPKTFPTDSPYYQIDPAVDPGQEPGFLKFQVSARHAAYEEEGLPPLAKLLREIEVIERILREEAGTGFFDGAVDSVEATGEGFVKLVTHPVESGKGLGKAAGKLGGKIGGLFRGKEEGEKTSFGEKMLGSSKREIAKEFGVDVYSSNPHLQELLSKMAKARLGGKGAAIFAKFLLPVAGLVSVTITASGVNSAADQLVNDHDRGDLYRLNREALELIGFGREEIKNFLSLPFYSPREATYMRFYLERLKEAKGYREIFHHASRVKSLWQARKLLYEAQIAADAVSDRNLTFDQLQLFEEGLSARSGGRLIFITPYDHLDRSPLGERVLERVESLKGEGGRGAEIWNGGKVTLDFSAKALLLGIKAKGWFLLLSHPDPV